MQCVSKYHYHFLCLPSQINGRNAIHTLRLQGTTLLSQICDSQISPRISCLTIPARHNFPLSPKILQFHFPLSAYIFFHAFFVYISFTHFITSLLRTTCPTHLTSFQFHRPELCSPHYAIVSTRRPVYKSSLLSHTFNLYFRQCTMNILEAFTELNI